MKKIIFYVILISGLQLAGDKAFAQFKKGDKLLNLGIGLNSYSYDGLTGNTPLSASFEVGIDDNISIGVNFDYVTYSNSRVSVNSVYLGPRFAYHFNELLNLNNDKIDLYGVASLGYRSNFVNSFYYGISAGGKYYFSKSTAVFTELGAVGATNFRVGLAFKF